MSLRDATPLAGPLPPLPPGPPYAARALEPWRGVSFRLPPGDPRLAAIHDGGPAPTPPLDNLVGAARAWQDHPEWLDFLDPDSPVHAAKAIERALYLDRWAPLLPPGCRVLDLGGGVGRFTAWLLDRGCEVELVDPDLRALWRAVSHAAGRPGRLDVHWSTGEALPDLAPVDAVIAVEVLCYAEDPARVLDRVAAVLRPGGHLLCSVEARWGWAMALDAAPGSLAAFLDRRPGDGEPLVVHVPGDRWVRTFDRDELAALLAPRFEVLDLAPTHYTLGGPFELAAEPRDADEARRLEARLRDHPVAAPLHRAWTATCRLRPRAAPATG